MTTLRGRVLSLAALGVLLSALPLGAAESPQASGKFKGSRVSFNVAGAYAFWSRSSDEGPVIEVAVSNDAFRTEAFDAFYDPRPVIDTMFVDDQTAVVYFQFEPNGKYHGMSYYLASGDGCGFCYDSSVKSTVTVSGQHIKARIAWSDENRTFDLQFDVPVSPREWGKPIAGDGGEIGGAYRAYNAAMEKGDRKAIFDLLDSENRESWTKREKEGKLDAYLDYRAEKVHWNLKSARIVRGYVRENRAVLLIKGSTPILDHVHGQVTLSREGGRWRIGDEVYEVGE